MPTLLTQQYRTAAARQFLTALQYSEAVANVAANSSVIDVINAATANITPTTLYLFVGKPDAWVDTGNVAVSDPNPPTPNASVQATALGVWRDMLGAKRLYAANVAFVVERRNWTANTIYTQYDDTRADLYTEPFYVLDTTSALPYKVYKCLWNNQGVASTVAPGDIVGTSTIPVQTADGYVWQYLYTIASVNDKFLTADWMPVYADATVQTAARTFSGKLPVAVPLLITNAGSGYDATSPTIVTTISGDGSGAIVPATGVGITGGTVTSLLLSEGGRGYTQVTSINVYQVGMTTPAQARALIPPYPNHGFDPLIELHVRNLMSVTRLTETEGGKLTSSNNYRKIGILANPLTANLDIATDAYYKQTYDLTFNANTGVFAADDTIINNSLGVPAPTAVIVDVVTSNATYTLRVTNVNRSGHANPFSIGDEIESNSGVTATLTAVSVPELESYSGHVAFVTYRSPVTRDPNQIEEIKIVFPFG